jgi:hypothetical protein
MTVSAACDGVRDEANRLGVAIGARAAWDRLDRHEPPPAPERSLSVAFPHEAWGARGGRYAADFRATAAAGGGHIWPLDVAKTFQADGGNTVLLEFGGLADVPADLEVSLLDRKLGRVQDLRESATYSFHLGVKDPVATEADARFVILVGAAEYVDGQLDELTTPPLRTALHQNYPNPFNPETVIRCDVARAGNVDLKIYDLTGALVKTLQAGVLPAGGHEFVWRGEDDRGRPVASGVYIYRLTTADAAQTKRMTLLK